MSASFFRDLPKIHSSDFSILLMEETLILKREKNKIMEFLRKFHDEDFETLRQEFKGMTLLVGYASMKTLVSIFDIGDARYLFVKNTTHRALELIAEMAVRPSEVLDGLDLFKKTPSILRSTPRPSSFGEILVELLVLSLTILMKKLEVFEIRQERLTLQKIKAVKSLSEIMLLLNGAGETSEKITECMKSICEGEIGLQDVLEKASGADLVALLSKTEEEYGGPQVVQTQRRRHLMSKQIFDYKWTHILSPRYNSRIYVNLEGDAICYVELLVHYLDALNLRLIHVEMNYAELKTDLFGEDETAENWVMLKIALHSQDAHLVVRGEVEIRSNSEDLCDLARDQVNMLKKTPEMIKF